MTSSIRIRAIVNLSCDIAERRTLTCPYGTTRSYGEIAKEIGQPVAVRAVARANGASRLALIRLPPAINRPRAVKYPANDRPLQLYPLKFPLPGVRG